MNDIRKLFTKGKVFTIPNFLTLFRIILIPVFAWLYVKERNFNAALIVLGISALSDCLDGIVARKFNQISELGKILDPVADMLTQVALIFCLTTTFPQVWKLIGVMICKMLLQGIFGYLVLKKEDVMPGAQWYGKLSTTVVNISMILLTLFPQMPEGVVDMLVTVCMIMLGVSMILYIIKFIMMLEGKGGKSL